MTSSDSENASGCNSCGCLRFRKGSNPAPRPIEVGPTDNSKVVQQTMRPPRDNIEGGNARFSDNVSFYSAPEDTAYLPGERVSADTTFPMGSTVLHKSVSPDGTYWTECTHDIFNVRVGPDYKKHGKKAPSHSFLYEPFGADVLRSDVILSDIAPHLLFPPLPDYYDSACGLPAIILVNAQLPLATPSPFTSSENDPGWSCIGYFRITKETVDWALNRNPCPPALPLLKRILERGFSDKSLAFKAIGMVDDLENQNLPMMSLLSKYNGKPVLVTASSKFHFGTKPYPYLEIDYNVRRWSLLARTTLVQLTDKLKTITVHVGYLVEATENEDLPERMLGGTTVSGLDLAAARFVKFDS